ncbi:sex comb on midleg-like protein 1 isoform X2 [Talpa occidentalis]|uniref:sex comb on midleg-like protein 1 isoform X2 n=1 Tax=Talpa occidentalis TaxID=50954 RepID=UPI00188EDCC5|nr:sex comb on midleg-like protein 1 isoform X2 [Talpa occidentalis]
MSSGSSEVDVIRTRIPAYDDDNSVLYAYEPNTSYINNEKPVSGVAHSERHQKTVLDILSHCQVIYEAIQNLDKKFDVIHGKVTRLQRFRMKSLWQHRKLLGYAYKNYSYLLSKKIKFLKMKKKDPPAVFSYPESYSPTMPVDSQIVNDSQSNTMGTPFQSDESLDQDLDSPHQDHLILSQSPTIPLLTSHSYRPYFTPDESVPGTSAGPCFESPGSRSIISLYSPTIQAADVPAPALTQAEPVLAHNSETVSCSALADPHAASSLCVPTNIATNSSEVNDLQRFPEDPATWTVDEVIKFLKHTDHQTLAPVTDLFREHDIDGKALLLLNSDMMIKYMGLKLGTAVKLTHYIEKLKDEKYFDN